MMGLRGQWTMQGNDVTIPEQFFLFHIGYREGCIRVGIVSQYLHAKALTDVDKGLTDLTGPDDADGLSMKVKAGQSIQCKVAFSRPVISLVELPVQTKQHSHRMLGNGIRRIRRHTHDLYLSCGCLAVHIVKAGTS